MASNPIGTILLLLFWIFVIRAVVRFIKKAMGATEPPKKPAEGQTETKQPQTFTDIFRELQKQVKEAEEKQHVPPYATLKEIKQKAEEMREEKKLPPPVIKENVIEKEKKAVFDYQKFVESQKQTEHDAGQSLLARKIYSADAEEENTAQFELDLRNAILGSIILERPYK